jgi:hypothetical protein
MIQAPTWFAALVLLVALVAPLCWGAAGVWIVCRLTNRPSPFPSLPTLAKAMESVGLRKPQAKEEEPEPRKQLRDLLPKRINP